LSLVVAAREGERGEKEKEKKERKKNKDFLLRNFKY